MITTAALSPHQRDGVQELLAAATAHDGVAALDEAARLALDGPGAQHLLLTGEGGEDVGPVGYASVLTDGTVQGMVLPEQRRRGHGTALLRAALALRPDAGVWAHGALEGSLAFLAGAGLVETRRLLTLHRDLADALPPVPPLRATDLQVGTYVPERDADDWVAVNAAAFADHPEQGALTREDLARREAEPWFDPEDLLVARRGEHLIGFVWVKREPVAAGETPGDAEIYVVGTSPAVQGQGVAGHLLGTALARLRAAGVPGVELYVEADNTAALRLYEAWGFEVSGRDVQMRTSAGR